jgi:predicted dienelactone hydrolase
MGLRMTAISLNRNLTKRPLRMCLSATLAMLLIGPRVWPQAQNSGGVGMSAIRLIDPVGRDTMEGFVFYPSVSKARRPATIGSYEVAAAPDAAALPGPKPLVVLSHGGGGTALGHHDLATYLAAHDLVVATLEHPFDNVRDQSGNGHSQVLVGRPIQVTAVITHLLTDLRWKQLIDPGRIGVAGFSNGGYTSLLLVGAIPRFQRFVDYCRRRPDDLAICVPIRQLESEAAASGRTVEESMASMQHDLTRWGPTADPRIKAAFLMAPLSLCFDATGFATVNRPVFLYYADRDRVLEPKENAEFIRPLIATLVGTSIVRNADHWVFLSPCSAPLMKAVPSICSDPNGITRRDVHAQINSAALSFFGRTLTLE